MKTALIQLNASDNKQKNIEGALRLAQRAINNGAQFILLPEVFNYRGLAHLKNGYSFAAENIPGVSSLPFLKLAKQHRVFILIGSLYEKIKNSTKVFNTSVLIDDQGKVAAKYRKIHLFEAIVDGKNLKESRFFKAGKNPAIAAVKDFQIGMTICYDLRFPEIYRAYARRGVDVLCIPSSFTKTTGQAHWETLLRARAIENLAYVLAPNQFGVGHAGVETFGNSMIIDPWGKIIARAKSDKEEIIYATLQKEELSKARKRLPNILN